MKIMMGLARNGNPYLTYTPYSPTLHSSHPRRFLPTKSAQKRGSQHIIRTTAGVSLNKPAGQPASRPASPTSSVQPVQSILSVQSPARPFSITVWDNLRHFTVIPLASLQPYVYTHRIAMQTPRFPAFRTGDTALRSGQGHGQRQISPFRAASAVYLYSFANLCPTPPAAC